MLIIDVFMLPEESVLRMWTGVGHNGANLLIQQRFTNVWGLVSGNCSYRLGAAKAICNFF
ncbi:hypothetical protein SAMN04488689_11940 [Paenibacillus sp. cl6col]|nr:hypothetical protein SAMN04488689_11940 [Paenibacillus sp. cl6col]